MVDKSRPESSLSGIIDELVSLYPEMDKKTARRLFCNQEDEKSGISVDGEGKNQSPTQPDDDETKSDTDSTVILSSDDEDEKPAAAKNQIEGTSKPEIVDFRQEVDDWLQYRTPAPLKFGRMKTFRTPGSASTNKASNNSGSALCENEFLASLSEIFVPATNVTRKEEAMQFVNNFRKRKDSLIQRLFILFNERVFRKQLPSDLKCDWNVRLTKTAGICKYTAENGRRVASIELSMKVCDNAERVRDTLVHELCHAAVWIIHGGRGGHDSAWKYWARQANQAFPALPLIKRCHAYQIHAKYLYTCTTCCQQVRRHSKSLDIEKKACGHCRGRFELREDNVESSGLLPATATKPRSTPKFALYVKSNYSDVKERKPDASHAEIMRDLGGAFRKLELD